MKYTVTVAGKKFQVLVEDAAEGATVKVGARDPRTMILEARKGPLLALRDGPTTHTVVVERGPDETSWDVQLTGRRFHRCTVEDERTQLAHAAAASGGKTGPRTVVAVMPGIVVKVAVEAGKSVAVKDALLVVEAMKMQNEIRAELAGRITKVHVKPGQSIAAGAKLVEISPE